MDRDFKAMFAVLFLVAGLFTGTNAMVNNESESNWVMWTLLFLALAVFFFIWLKRDDQQAKKSASDRAREALGDAQKKLENTAQAVATAEKAAGVDKVELEEARAQAQAMEQATATTEEPVKEPEAAKPNGETLIEDAKDEEPVASSVVSDQSAAKTDEDHSDDITPSDDPSVKDDTDDEETTADAEPAEADTAEETTADAKPAEEAIEKGEMTPDQPAASGEPDDLTIVEGIGPYYRDLLIEQGIDTFAKLAALTESDIIELVQNAGGRKRASMATWPDQAKLAAAGDFDGLEKLKENLTAGRRD